MQFPIMQTKVKTTKKSIKQCLNFNITNSIAIPFVNKHI